jgi:hypothetical protein
MCGRGPDDIARRMRHPAAEAPAEFDTSELATGMTAAFTHDGNLRNAASALAWCPLASRYRCERAVILSGLGPMPSIYVRGLSVVEVDRDEQRGNMGCDELEANAIKAYTARLAFHTTRVTASLRWGARRGRRFRVPSNLARPSPPDTARCLRDRPWSQAASRPQYARPCFAATGGFGGFILAAPLDVRKSYDGDTQRLLRPIQFPRKPMHAPKKTHQTN